MHGSPGIGDHDGVTLLDPLRWIRGFKALKAGDSVPGDPNVFKGHMALPPAAFLAVGRPDENGGNPRGLNRAVDVDINGHAIPQEDRHVTLPADLTGQGHPTGFMDMASLKDHGPGVEGLDLAVRCIDGIAWAKRHLNAFKGLSVADRVIHGHSLR